MEIIRYINGIRLKGNDMSKYIVESKVVLETIRDVNERLKNNRQNNDPEAISTKT